MNKRLISYYLLTLLSALAPGWSQDVWITSCDAKRPRIKSAPGPLLNKIATDKYAHGCFTNAAKYKFLAIRHEAHFLNNNFAIHLDHIMRLLPFRVTIFFRTEVSLP